MPIHTSWRSMVQSMLANASYCKRSPKRKCHPFTDGKKTCGCAGGWSVFFATMRKRGWDETKPRHEKVSEAVFAEAVKQTEMDFIEWFVESRLKKSNTDDDSVPRWIGLAKRIISSPKFSDKMKVYWRSRLEKWCKENPENKACKGVKNDKSS